ncbi:hypothetical protein CAEBREN_14588 [Caenorhabditis brenneri]|uniref:Uncharacterized protein n=1 Tax=Caenorhabditis brenneri TaxID=135651 RepID=G0MJ26_CAEBE|nr:hypothetical protein CAEBREN_14588 [Caenorhabditis brenneri]
MVVELNFEYDAVPIPCLMEEFPERMMVQEVAQVKRGNRGDAEHRQVEVEEWSDDTTKITTMNNPRGEENGAALFFNDIANATQYLVAVKPKSGLDTETNLYIKIEALMDSLCDLVGICTETNTMPLESTTLEPTSATSGATKTSGSPATSGYLETSTAAPITKIAKTTVIPPAVPHRRTMPPEYVDHGDYDMIFDSLYEFPEFREIEERPDEKKGGRKSFELVLVIFIVFLV